MANFTSNQVNHVLVAESFDSSFSNNSALGAIKPFKTDDGKYLYFKLQGKGGVTRSDLIEIDNIMYAKATKATAMGRNLKYELIQLNSDIHTTTTLGGAYILNFEFQNPLGMSPDNRYFKHAAVNTSTEMTASAFYAKLGESITRNMSREGTPLVKAAAFYISEWDGTSQSAGYVGMHNGKIYRATATTGTSWDATKWAEVVMTKPINFVASSTEAAVGDLVANSGIVYVVKTAIIDSDSTFPTAKVVKLYEEITTSNAASLSSVTGVLVMEVEQPGYRRGINPDTPIMWHTAFSAVTVGSTEYPWGTTTPITGPKLSNSKKIADFEYFAMGERADRYRGMGWPNNIDTEYMVDPTYSTGYDTINIHYAYVGSNESVQKSEKDLTIVVKSDGNGTSAFAGYGSVTQALISTATYGINSLVTDLVEY